jgi:hypothetical protein
MSKMTAIRRVILGSHHLNPGRGKHGANDSQDQSELPSCAFLVIGHYPDDHALCLLRVCENGTMAETRHETLDEAFRHAEWEFEVRPEEWHETHEHV